MTTDPKLGEIIAYLEGEFPGSTIVVADGERDDELQFQVSAPQGQFTAIVKHDFLDAVALDEIKSRLDEYRLAGTLRDLAGLPIVVSVNGCIFV